MGRLLAQWSTKAADLNGAVHLLLPGNPIQGALEMPKTWKKNCAVCVISFGTRNCSRFDLNVSFSKFPQHFQHATFYILFCIDSLP